MVITSISKIDMKLVTINCQYSWICAQLWNHYTITLQLLGRSFHASRIC